MAKRRRYQNLNQRNFPISSTLVDVCIPVHRRFDLLKQCLDALPEAFGNIPYKVIILDNASPKEEADPFYSQYKGMDIIRNRENLGFPASCNKMFNRGVSPLVFFLNSDVILHAGSMLPLVKAMDDPKIGIAGMKLLFPEVTDLPQDGRIRPAGKVQHIGLTTTIHADFIHQFLGWSPDNPRVNAVRDVYAVTGAALLTRRVLYKQAGGFYEGYGKGSFEDVDYSLTIREMGYNVIVVPEAVGVHHTGATSQAYNMPHPLQQNRLIFMQRWANKLDWTQHWSA